LANFVCQPGSFLTARGAIRTDILHPPCASDQVNGKINQIRGATRMTTELHQKVTVRRGGWISFRLRELKAGSTAEVVVRVESPGEGEETPARKTMTAADLLDSGLVGMWAHRKDIPDSSEYARQLRQQAEHREIPSERIEHDSALPALI
jgi:hypothetical protein